MAEQESGEDQPWRIWNRVPDMVSSVFGGKLREENEQLRTRLETQDARHAQTVQALTTANAEIETLKDKLRRYIDRADALERSLALKGKISLSRPVIPPPPDGS